MIRPRLFFLTLLCLLSAGMLRSQTLRIKNDIKVRSGADTLLSPWAGGLNAVQFSPLDLDNDGTQDLVAFERTDVRVIPFLNEGTIGTPKYRYAPEYLDVFPAGLFGWVLFRDFDGDGDQDIFSATQTSNVRVWRNTSAGTGSPLTFALYKSEIYSRYPSRLWLYVPSMDIPSLTDLDGDSDLDFLNFDVLGYQVEWHKNISADSGWGLDSVEYVLQSYCYGHFFEEPVNCGALVDQTPCAAGNRPWEDPNEMAAYRHAGSTLTAMDFDADGVQDLVVGDVTCSYLYTLHNGGTTSIAHFDTSITHFPHYDTPVNVELFPGSFHLDIDNDGIRDLLTAPNATDDLDNDDGVWYYRNTGTDAVPHFTYQQTGFLQDNMIEAGTGAAPAFFDYDQDGLLDLLVGNYGIFDTVGTYATGLALYRNEGTAARPAYVLQDPDFLGLKNSTTFGSLLRIKPTLGDLDNDGDDDLVFGEQTGKLHYWRNDASGGAANFQFVTDNYTGIDFGAAAAPCLYDLDSDGDLDLIIGNQKGYLTYMKNAGTASSASFTWVTDSLGHIKINDFTNNNFSFGYSHPAFGDTDGDTKPELLVGGVEGEVWIYADPTDVVNASFPMAGKLASWDFGAYASPAAALLDTSDVPTFLIGLQRGGVALYGRPYGPVVTAREEARMPAALDLWPNPATGSVRYSLPGVEMGTPGHIRLMDAQGRICRESSLRGNAGELELENLAPGIYLFEYSSATQQVSRRLSILR